MVPDVCDAYGDVRLLPGLSAEEVKRIVVEQLNSLSITDYSIDDLLVIPAVETNRHAGIVQILAGAVKMVTGISPRREGAGPACDGWMFVTRGIPTVCGYGATCGGVHGADEWVDVESLQKVTEVYAHTIWHYLTSTSLVR
jgi:succinyl-diaminopimelate desuccinylase